MRKSSTIPMLLCLCFLVSLVACTTEETRVAELAVSRYSLAFPVGGGITSVTVSSANSWTATTDASWLTLAQGTTDENNFATLTVTAEANYETASVRESEIIIASAVSETVVSVLQEPMSDDFDLYYDSAACNLDSEGGAFIVRVSGPSDWTAALSEAVDGWEMTTDTDAGTVTVTASANYDSAKGATLTVSSETGESGEIVLTQGSHADNAYFKYIGNWNVYADKWYYNSEYYDAGTYDSCSITEYSYPACQLDLNDFSLTGAQLGEFEYDPETGTIAFPMGYVCGYVFMSGYYWYIYIVCINLDDSSFQAGNDIIGTLSSDGQSIELSGFTEGYTTLGYVGYNTYYYYFSLMTTATYPIYPITFTRADDASASQLSVGMPVTNGLKIHPVDIDNLPEGVPARFPADFKGTFRLSEQL
ncbi:MAG: hypothetical protein LUE27_10095 [Clostridia bacterium]|nr:hypothetical protein [Clostridia bacterium]